MALSSEDREIWLAEVQTAREDVAEDTRKKARPFPDQVAKVAVADHLAAVEALLGEIDDCLLNVNFSALPEDGHTTLNDDVARDWQERVADLLGREKWWLEGAALLGPAATKED